jgi:hypothetical protein
MTFILITVALAATARSLWIRRDTWRSSWEISASLSVALHGCAVLMMSPWAAALVGPRLYHIFGRWNVQHLLGHIMLILAATAIIRHLLVRLADQQRVGILFGRQVIQPVNLGVLLLMAIFVVADEGYHPDLFAAHVGNFWFGVYWVLLGGLLIYLFGYAGRVLLILRADPRCRATADMYLLALVFGAAAGAAQLGTAWAGADVALPVWIFGCLSLISFAHGSARSWQAKVNWFITSNCPPPQSLPA